MFLQKEKKQKPTEKKEERLVSPTFSSESKNKISQEPKNFKASWIKNKFIAKEFFQKIPVFLNDHFFILFKSAAENHLRIQKHKVAPIEGESCNLSFTSYSDLKRYQKKVRILTFSFSSTLASVLIAMFVIQVFFPGGRSLGATYLWNQTRWDFSATSDAETSHDISEGGRTSNTAYTSRTPFIMVNNYAPSDTYLNLSKEIGNAIKHDDNTTFNAQGSAFNSAAISGTGNASVVQLSSNTVAVNAWGDSPAPPAFPVAGAVIQLISQKSGEDFVYVLASSAAGKTGADSTLYFYKYQVSTHAWITPALATPAGFLGNSGIGSWFRTTKSDGSDDAIYMFMEKTATTVGLFKYSISSGTWTNPIVSIGDNNGYGFVATLFKSTTDNDLAIYYKADDNSLAGFAKFSIDQQTNASLPNTLALSTSSEGSSMVGYGDSIYLQHGGGTGFEKYTVANTWNGAGSWTNLVTASPADPVPAATTWGKMITNGTDGYIYLLRGNNQNSFYRYKVGGAAGSRWKTLATLPGTTGYGNSMIRGIGSDSNSIYVVAGNGTANFYKYTIDPVEANLGSWATLTNASSSNFTATSFNYNFASRNGENNFLTYNTSGLKNSLFAITGDGGLYEYTVNKTSYAASGDYTSPVIDAGMKVNDWGDISWLQTLNGGTVGIQIATNDDGVTWNFKGPDGNAHADCSQVGYCYAGTGTATAINAIHDGNRYLKYKIFFTRDAANVTATPTVDWIQLNGYAYYPTGQTLISAAFDTLSDANVMDQITWTEDAVAYDPGTEVGLSMRTATSKANLAGTSWSVVDTSGCSKNVSTGVVTCPKTVLPASMLQSTMSANQWFQYKLTFNSNGQTTPTVYDVQIKYVVNAPPVVSGVTAAQNSNGTVTVNYSVLDPDTDTGVTPNQVNVTLKYCTANCTSAGSEVWATAAAIIGDAGVVGGISQGSAAAKTITWTPKTDYAGQYNGNMKIRVEADDNELANHLSYASSANFVLDTKNPVASGVAVKVDARGIPANSAAVTLSASDDTTGGLQMKVSTSPTLAGASWENYASSKSISLATVPATIYVQFLDAYGNTSDIFSATTPNTPVSAMIIETSNFNEGSNESRLFVAWKVISAPSPGFAAYKVFRSTDQTNWAQIGTDITNILTNYLSDNTVTQGTDYYYRVAAYDMDGNVSAYSSIVHGNANGVQDGGEGTGGEVPPTITGVTVDQISTTSARINWTTNTISTSTVGFSTSQGVFTSEQGVGSMVTDHHVTLTGLTPNTPYYFQVKSSDVNNLLSVDNSGGNGYSFSTILGDVTPPVISNVDVSSVTSATATITWTTNENADSFVEYSKTNNFTNGAFVGDYGLGTSHSVTISSLEADATYYFKVHSKDGSNNSSVSSQQSFTTLTSGDVTPPQISEIVATPSFNSANISWTTDESSTSFVEYGETTAYGRMFGDAQLVLTHGIQLPYDLNQLTTYHFRVHSVDGSGNEAISDDQTFATTLNPADVTPPIISNVTVGTPSTTSVTLTWDTNESATSFAEYSLDGNTFTQQGSSQLATFHSVTVVGLTPDTPYYLRVVSSDASQNKATNDNGGLYYVISTAKGPQPPTLLNVASDGITYNQADITWNTNVGATSIVEYGLTASYGSAAGSFANVTSHSVTIKNLLPSQTYHFRVRSIGEEEAISGDYTFMTTTAPDTTPAAISGVSVSVNVRDASIDWATDENSSTTVYYGTTDNYSGIIGNKNASEKNHSVSISKLEPATVYHYQIESKDGSGNVADTTDQLFTTLNDTSKPVISNVTELSVAQTSAVISWETDKDASTEIIYGKTHSLTSNSQTALFGKAHFISLTGLEKATTYYYKVVSRDAYGNEQQSAEKEFLTAPDASQDHPPLSSITFDDKNPSVITDTAAVISFSTDQVANCFIEFGTQSGSYSYTPAKEREDVFNKSHAISLTGLLFKTDHYYKVTCQDNLSTPTVVSSEEKMFTTLDKMYTQNDINGLGDHLAPTITNVKIGNTTGESVTITWDTDEKASSNIRYGLSLTDENTAGDGAVNKSVDNYTTSHSVTIYGLIPATKYIFVASSIDTSGNIGSSSQSDFTTASPSSLSSVNVSSTSLSEALITWKTGQETNSTVEYGISTSYGQKKESTSFSKDHSIKLDSLDPGVTYHFRVKGKDRNNILYASADNTFIPKSPAKISDVEIKDVTEHEATIVFSTDVPTSANVTYVSKNDQTDNGASADGELRLGHSITLKNLTQGTTFAIKISVRDEQGTESTIDGKDLTTGIDSAPPKIDQVRTDSALTQSDKVQTIINWKTDEQATTALVYKEGRNAEEKELKITDNLTTGHIAVVTSFKPGTVYYFRVKSVDGSDNEAVSNEFALLTPRRKENIIQIIINNFQDIFGWAQR